MSKKKLRNEFIRMFKKIIKKKNSVGLTSREYYRLCALYTFYNKYVV